MLTIRKMQPTDLPELYDIALCAFQEDFELYGQYPPLLDQKRRRLRPGTRWGYVFACDGRMIGGGYAWQLAHKATLGAIFIAPEFQGRGLGQQIMRMIENQFPTAKRWRLETPYQSYRNHHFYEKLGYKKIGMSQPDKRSDFKVIRYEKSDGSQQ